ncbi:MAG: hypothetical protein CMJ85_10370 [Planctomycetes bacterium]|jgi:heptosyltransferase-2|nr:hypothetical protein [Planctomycetota bacterium]
MDSPAFHALARDCRWFRPERPCLPHKLRGKVCEGCDEYDPIDMRVAIVKLGAVGDVLRTTAFLPGLRRRYPNASVSWLTRPEAAPLFVGNEFVDELHTTNDATLPETMRCTPFDLVICPDADHETASLATGLRLREGGRRIGYGLDGDGRVEPLSESALAWLLMGVSDARKKANTKTYQTMLGEIFELPLPIEDRPMLALSDTEVETARRWLATATANKSWRTLVGINTGAGGRWPRKQWTLGGQIGLITALAADGDLTVLLGGSEERQRHAELCAACPDACIDAGNDNGLREFAARLGLCDALVTGDTMALHLGCALGKPTIALFGPTSSAEIDLYGRGSKVFAEGLDCLVCYGTCDREPSCQDLISVDMVREALAPWLAAASNKA